MAQCAGSVEFSNKYADSSDHQKYFAEEWAIEDRLFKISNNLPEGELIGFIMTFPVGDGYALYRVVSTKPFKLEHLALGDAYSIPDAHIRGLKLEDAKQQQRFDKEWNKPSKTKSHKK